MRRGGGSSGSILGRRRQRAALDELLARVRAGESASVLMHGEAGIGKTVLLDYVAGAAGDLRVVRVAGAESETELAFGGLHQLCAPFIDHLGQLPGPQQDALSIAFGLTTGVAPDRFLIGLGVLSLLAEAAQDRPLVCLVDDAQWLDAISAQALAFAARRLQAERVMLVVAMRDPLDDHPLRGLRRLEVEGLSDADARALLSAVRPGRIDDRIRDRIVAETRGNPLALLELPRDLTDGEGAAPRSVNNDHFPMSGRLERGFLQRVHELPDDTQQLLLVAAAESLGDVSLLHRAAEKLAIAVEPVMEPAVSAGLLTVRHVVRFRHPLVRSAIYRAATPTARQAAHRVLADVTDAEVDPDRQIWHLARATSSPDEGVAAALERGAERAEARGGVAAAAAFLARAAQLTPDPAVRGSRTLAAAQAKHQAGAFTEALELLDAADVTPLDELSSARAALLRGRILFASRSASAGLPTLLGAAKRLESLDPVLARETYRDAYYAAITAGRLPGEETPERIAAAVLTMAPGDGASRSELLLEGSARLYADGYAQGVLVLREALAAYRNSDVLPDEGLGWLSLASRMAHNALDFESYSTLSEKLVALAHETGSLSVLPSALLLHLASRVFAGDLPAASVMASEAANLGEAMGGSFFAHYGALVLEPWRGNEDATRRVIEVIKQNLALSGEGKVFTATEWAAAVLYNGLGRYDEAYTAAKHGAAYPEELGLSIWSTVELVEAAVHLGRPEDAAEAVDYIVSLADSSGSDWALGTAASVTAQVGEGDQVGHLYEEAIDRLARAGVHLQKARVHLLYGEWLRREGRRTDARQHLSIAHDTLSTMGVAGFAERARRELEASGATARRSSTQRQSPLTAQEEQIARLAAEGLTNPQIGAQLFISAHTVEWHLRKVFTKLGIRSRKEIRRAWAGDEAT